MSAKLVEPGVIMAEWQNFLHTLTQGHPEIITSPEKFRMMQTYFAGFASSACLLESALHSAVEIDDDDVAATMIGDVFAILRSDCEVFSEAQRATAEKYNVPTTSVQAGAGLRNDGEEVQ